MLNSLKKIFSCGLVLAASLTFAQGAPDESNRVLNEVPGFDFSKLSGAAKKELATVLTDEFDYCGRPLTLLATLKKGDACKHTKRLVGLAALRATESVSATEILNELSKYAQSFSSKRAKLTVDDRLCVGPKDAKVTFVEFSDFECPFCAAARPVLEEVQKAKANMRLCYSPFPIQSHAHGTMAAQAALFARDHGKFWQMHDWLFENQMSLSETTIKEAATKFGLDAKELAKVWSSGKYLEEIKASKEAGIAAGVDSTPTVFVNGRKMQLNMSTETFSLTVDDEADWVAGNNTWPKG